jgi:hypothetical protein
MLATLSSSLLVQSVSPAVKRRTGSSLRALAAAAFWAIFALMLVGCGIGQQSDGTSEPSPLPQIAGQVHGGQQPVAGATMQLYAANTTTAQGAAAALISKTVRTDSNGYFTITADYTCPAPGALVYIVAFGGNPGLPGVVGNANLAMMAILGTCSSLTASTVISINELTTVAAVEALAPFMQDYAHVGASAANVAGLSAAFSSATAIVSSSTGQITPTPASGVVPPTALINTLAGILAACINSGGGTSGDGSFCGTLLHYTSTRTDTIAALLSIAHSPAANVPQLFGLVGTTSPYQPVLPSVPSSFVFGSSLPFSMNYHEISDVVLADSQYHVWLLRPYPGTLSEYDSNLNLLHSFYVGEAISGGTAFDIALDPENNIWVPYGAALLKISSSGTLLSPANGYPLPQSGIAQIYQNFTFDAVGNVWGIVIRASDSAYCLIEESPTGNLLSPATGYCGSQVKAANHPQPEQVVADGSGNVFLFYFSPGLTEEFMPDGSFVDIPVPTYTTGVSGFYAAVFDPDFQQFWGAGELSLNTVYPSGTVVSSVPYSSYFVPSANGMAVDASGTVWIANNSGILASVGPTGSAACLTTTGTLCGIQVIPTAIANNANGTLAGVAVDPAGNLFTVDVVDGALLKLTGLAAAK